MKFVRQEFKPYLEMYLLVRECKFVFRDFQLLVFDMLKFVLQIFFFFFLQFSKKQPTV